MTVCPKYEKMLLLDVTGELDDRLRFSWQSHLKRCADCRQEKERLLSMVARIKTASPSPFLSTADADAMIANISRQIADNKKRSSFFPQWIRDHGKLIPAIAAACLLIITLSIFWQSHWTQQLGHHAMNNPGIDDVINPEEIDIIKNFELLKEFDSLEKLVQVVDRTEPDTPSTIEQNNSHGLIFNEKNILYS